MAIQYRDCALPKSFPAFPSPNPRMFPSHLAVFAALFASVGLLSFGHGAASSLIVQQGPNLGFSETDIGLFVSATYAGFFIGARITAPLLRRVAYIRAFAVTAAVTAAMAGLLPIIPANEFAWAALRFFYGLFFSASIVTSDGWMNAAASSENRSRVYSGLMVTNYVAYGASQMILILGARSPDAAFSATTVCLILALIPVCLTRFPEPQLPASRDDFAMSHRDAYRIAPVTFVGQFGTGMVFGASWLFVSYAQGLGLDSEKVAVAAGLFYLSGFAAQAPIGWIADRLRDRRAAIAGVAAASAALSAAMLFGGLLPWWLLLAVIFLNGAVPVTMFPLNMAYGHDFVERARASVYSSRVFESYAAGALLGPLAAGALMERLGPPALFGLIGVVFVALALFAFTDWLMPKFRPALSAAYQPAPPMTPPDLPPTEEVYTELDIGPDLPPDFAPSGEEGETVAPLEEVGPPEPESGTGEKQSESP